jgi:hypothetical protein
MTFTHHRRKNSSRMNARTRQSSAIGYRTPPVSVSSQSLSPDCLCGQTMYPRKLNPRWLRRSSVVSRAICRSPLPCGNINARPDLLRARLSAIQSMRAQVSLLISASGNFVSQRCATLSPVSHIHVTLRSALVLSSSHGDPSKQPG